MPIIPAAGASTVKGALVPIATINIAGASAANFTNIPQTYQDLYLVVQSRTVQTGYSTAVLWCWFNGTQDTVNGLYSYTYIYTNGSTVTSGRTTGANQADLGESSNSYIIPGVLPINVAHIPNYTSSTSYKNLLSRAGFDMNQTGYTDLNISTYRSTSPITSVYVRADGGATHVTGSTATLYGVRSIGQ